MTRRPYGRPISFRLQDDLRDRLYARAEKRGIDVSDVVREAIESHLDLADAFDEARAERAAVGTTTPAIEDQEPRTSYGVTMTREWMREVSPKARRMGMHLGEVMREGALHLVREHMPEQCPLCGGTQASPAPYCGYGLHDVPCRHRFHFETDDEWREACLRP